MMGQLMGIGNEITSELTSVLYSTELKNSMRGAQLDVDDYWEFAELINHFSRDSFPYYYLYPYRTRRRSYYWDQLRLLYQIRNIKNIKTDLNFRPSNWNEHCKMMGYPKDSGPIIIKILLKDKVNEKKADLPRSFANMPIIYEVRSSKNRAVAFNGFADNIKSIIRSLIRGDKAPSIGKYDPKTTGTLGGIFKSSDPYKSYLVTCGHVLGPPDTRVYNFDFFLTRTVGQIAKVVYYKIPEISSFENPCNENTNPELRSIDLAIAELNTSIDSVQKLGNIANVNSVCPINGIRKNDLVTFNGKVSGITKAKIGALTLWDQVYFPEGLRCFGRIFELKPISRQYIRQDLAKPGDSGSWIVSDLGNLTMWYGMLISCDGGQAYACFADYILENCQREFSNDLHLE